MKSIRSHFYSLGLLLGVPSPSGPLNPPSLAHRRGLGGTAQAIVAINGPVGGVHYWVNVASGGVRWEGFWVLEKDSTARAR